MKISVQLYSLRSVGDFDAQLALARDCGFDWVETVATHELAPAEFAARVAAHGLRVSSMHVSLALLGSQLDTIVEACRLSGCPLVVMPWLPMGERAVGGPAWAALGERLAGIGATLARSGLRLAYHNHDFEFLQHDGRSALEWIFGAAPASLLGWEADLGWVCRAGADPWLWLDRFGDRLAAVHAKDIAAPRAALDEDGWAPLGAGIVPWKKLLARLATQVDTIVFEHDLPRDPRAVLQTSRDFLRSELG